MDSKQIKNSKLTKAKDSKEMKWSKIKQKII